MLMAFASGSSNYLPLIEHIAFLFELMEIALNIHGLIEFCIQLLKELVDVETQLVQKNSTIAGSYATVVALNIVGVLYTYHCCLLVSQEQTISVFDGLCRIVKHITSLNDCSSAERCILAYLYDLNSSCSYVKLRHSDHFGSIYPKLKGAICSQVTATQSNLPWTVKVMIDHINDPRMKVDRELIKQLNEQSQFRFSFVCNAVHNICMTRDIDRLNEIAVLCAELTAHCVPLTADWLGVLKALCCSSNHAYGFSDILNQVQVRDVSIHDNLAILTSILVARRCFLLQDFAAQVALPSLLATTGGDPDAEPGARLTCHLIRRLFKKAYSPPGVYHVGNPPAIPASSTRRNTYYIKYPCDRHLLSAIHSGMRVEAILAVLKGFLVLGEVYLQSS